MTQLDTNDIKGIYHEALKSFEVDFVGEPIAQNLRYVDANGFILYDVSSEGHIKKMIMNSYVFSGIISYEKQHNHYTYNNLDVYDDNTWDIPDYFSKLSKIFNIVNKLVVLNEECIKTTHVYKDNHCSMVMIKDDSHWYNSNSVQLLIKTKEFQWNIEYSGSNRSFVCNDLFNGSDEDIVWFVSKYG